MTKRHCDGSVRAVDFPSQNKDCLAAAANPEQVGQTNKGLLTSLDAVVVDCFGRFYTSPNAA